MLPLSQALKSYPWQGCKFAASAVMLLVSKTDIASKKEAVHSLSSYLGGLRIPHPVILAQSRNPSILSEEIAKAFERVKRSGSSVALLVNTTDVEIMRNPGLRPGTFAHVFVLTISKNGMYILQGYGPLGYTLLQHMETHDDKFPLSEERAKEWAHIFEQYGAERGGKWTAEVNDAYYQCFGVNLVKLGSMKIGNQLDAYTTIGSFEFDADLVDANFALLPKKRDTLSTPKVLCLDGKNAKAKKAPLRFRPDGGVKHYYIPVVKRCGLCGKTEQDSDKSHARCSRCKSIHYCCKEHQAKDWDKHKSTCLRIKSLI